MFVSQGFMTIYFEIPTSFFTVKGIKDKFELV